MSTLSKTFLVVMIPLLIVAPFIGIYPLLAAKLLCFALFAAAFNLLLGYTGLLSFGHAAFFGGAAYVTGEALKVWGLSPELGLLAGTLFGAALGWLFGVLAIKRQGIYFAMVTLALAQLVYFVAVQSEFTGGEDGLQSVPRGKLFGVVDLTSDLAMYYVVLVVVCLALSAIYRIVNSPFGQVLAGIKGNAPRAISLGYDVRRVKLLAFVLSAALSGLAGALKTLVFGFATLSDLHWSMSGQVILMTLVGGLGTLIGPLVGSTVIVVLESKLGEIGNGIASLTGLSWFSGLEDSVGMVTGLLFIVCVLAFRQGVWGTLAEALRARSKPVERPKNGSDSQILEVRSEESVGPPDAPHGVLLTDIVEHANY